MFESLGLSQEILDLYRLLLQQPELARQSHLRELCATLHLPEIEVENRLDQLRGFGFLASRWDNSGEEYPLDPAVMFERLAAKRQSMIGELTQELEADRIRAGEFISAYNRFLTQDLVRDVEVLEGVDKANLRMQNFHPTKSLWALIAPAAHQVPSVSRENFSDHRIMARGVECRYLFAESHLKTRGMRDYLHYIAELGGLARVVPAVPFRMVIFDGESVALSIDPDNSKVGAVVHHSKAVVRMAVEMYEHYWRHADRSFERTPEPGELSGQEAEFLRFLVQGATDEQVARKLGVS
ncbi:hypothetical protein, partial [Kribbella albertanoniae]